MKLPIRQVPGSVPPRFEWHQMVNLPGGGTQAVIQQGCVGSSMEAALVDLIRIAKQLASDNEILRSIKK